MPNCPKLLAFAPLAMGAFILLFMDLSFNVTMQPFRALVADMLALAGVFMLLAAVSVFLVKEHKAQ